MLFGASLKPSAMSPKLFSVLMECTAVQALVLLIRF